MKVRYLLLYTTALFLFGVLIFPLTALSSPADQDVLDSTVQIQIYDNYTEKVISSGTGMAINGYDMFLTNYHVVEKVFNNPHRYRAFGCVTFQTKKQPNCKFAYSTTPVTFDPSKKNLKYNKHADLALLYVDKVYSSNDGWKDFLRTSIDDFKVKGKLMEGINLSEYTADYNALKKGDEIFTVGYPDYGDGDSVRTEGEVLGTLNDRNSDQPLILSNMNTSFGSSGGPVFNDQGELVGVNVKCITGLNGECHENLFIPLPTVHWWITNVTDLDGETWSGETQYRENFTTDDKKVLCILTPNAHYDSESSKKSCTCNNGYKKKEGVYGCVKKEDETKQQEKQYSQDNSCKKFGENWEYKKTDPETGNKICGCKDGYEQKGGSCFKKDDDSKDSFTEDKSCSDLESGDLVEFGENDTVYIINEDNEIMHFPGSEVFHSWFKSFDAVHHLEQKCSKHYSTPDEIPTGMTFRPGSTLVTTPLQNKVYAVTPNNVLRPIENEQVARALYGSNWKNEIMDVPSVYWREYENGKSITKSRPHDGMLISREGSEEVYFVKNQELYQVKSSIPGFLQRDVQEVSGEVFHSLEKENEPVYPHEITSAF